MLFGRVFISSEHIYLGVEFLSRILLKNFWAVFQSSYTILHSHKQRMRVQIFSSVLVITCLFLFFTCFFDYRHSSG